MNDVEKLTSELETLISYFHAECVRNSDVIECDEGSGAFVSVAAVNTYTLRMRRALRDHKYRQTLAVKENKRKGLKQ